MSVSYSTTTAAVADSNDDIDDDISLEKARKYNKKAFSSSSSSSSRPATASSTSSRCEVCVIGAGLSGLVLARDLASRGIDVAIVEATDRIGGHIESERLYDDLVVEYGAEWFDIKKQVHITEEVKRYGLTIIKEIDSTKTMFSYCSEKRVSLDKFPENKDDIDNYKSVVAKMEYAASKLDKLGNFSQLDDLDLDQCFSDYLDSLQPVDCVKEFFLCRAGRLLRTPPHMFSALQFIKVLAAFADETVGGGIGGGGADRFCRGVFYRIKEGFSELLDRIKNDFIKFGGRIQCNFPVQSVTAMKEVIEIVAYKDNGMKYTKEVIVDTIKVAINSGNNYFCSYCVSCIPMKCLTNIGFKPDLPEYVKYALSKSNIGDNCSEFTKAFVTARGVSNINRVLCSGPVIFECKVLARGIDVRKIVDHKTSSTSLISSHSFPDVLLNYPSCIPSEPADTQSECSVEILPKLTASSSGSGGSGGSGRVAKGGEILWSESIKSLNKAGSYSTKESRDKDSDSVSVSSSSSKRDKKDRKDKNKGARQKEMEEEVVQEVGVEEKPLEIKLENQNVAILAIIIPDEIITNRIVIERELKKYHPTICDIGWISYREYYTDVWLKGASFSLRKGMSLLYDEVCSVSKNLYKEIAATTFNGMKVLGSKKVAPSSSSSSTSSSSSSSSRGGGVESLTLPPVGYQGGYKVHSTWTSDNAMVSCMNFMIGGAEFCNNGWAGWMDGAVQNAKENAKHIANIIRPPDKDYNMMKRIHDQNYFNQGILRVGSSRPPTTANNNNSNNNQSNKAGSKPPSRGGDIIIDDLLDHPTKLKNKSILKGVETETEKVHTFPKIDSSSRATKK